MLGLLLLGATLALHVEEVGEVPPPLGAALVETLADLAAQRTGLTVVIDDERGECLAGQPCAAAVASRTSASEVVLVRLLGGPLRVRVVLEHVGRARRGEADVARSWTPEARDALAALVAEVLEAPAPEGTAAAGPPLIAPALEAPAVPWLAAGLVGAGVASAVGATIMGAMSQSTTDELRAGSSEVVALGDEARSQALVSHVLWAVAAGALAAGVTAWLAQ